MAKYKYLLCVDFEMSSYVKHSFLTSPQHCGHPVADGATLVIPSRYVDLNEQVRTTDKFHAGVVAKLQRRQGMTMSDLQKYDILSNEDFSDPDSPWYTAPIIVPINRDRYKMKEKRISLFSNDTAETKQKTRSADLRPANPARQILLGKIRQANYAKHILP
jgi:hypothetical protein